MDSPFNILSLCSGIGGLDVAVHLAVPQARTVCWVEWEAYCVEVLAARMEEGALAPAPVWTDLATFDGRAWRGRVHCVTAGYPCQPFSVAGKRRGAADERHLWPQVAGIIRDVEPGYVFLENVPGHLVLGFDEVLGALADMGFDAAWGTLQAGEVGASQRRERLFCLACANEHAEQRSKPRSDQRQVPHGDGEGAASAPSSGFPSDLQQDRHTPSHPTDRHPCGRDTDRQNPGVAGTQDPNGGWASGKEHPGRGPAEARRPDLPLFPPGPGDLAGWQRVLAEAPELAPSTPGDRLAILSAGRRLYRLVAPGINRRARGKASRAAFEPYIRDMADGMADRVDRLRMLGNGVVPLQAAYAFCALLANLGE